MRSWRHLIVVCCLTLLVAEPALAASRPQQPAKPLIEYVLLCGLIAIPAGQSTITSPPDHSSITLSSLTNSGLDGMNVGLLNVDGESVHLTNTCSNADVNARCSMTYAWSIRSAPASSACRTAFTVLVDQDELSAEFPASSRTTATVRFYLGDVLVQSKDAEMTPRLRLQSVPYAFAPNGPGLTPSGTGVSATRETPTLWASCDHVQHVLLSSFTYTTLHVVTLNGQSVQCDRVVVVCAMDPESEGVGDHGELRVTSPPGSSFSSVTVDHQSCTKGGRALFGLTGTALTCSSGQCSLDNLDPSGQGGVQVEREASAPSVSEITVTRMVMANPSLTFDPVLDNGASFDCRVLGGGGCSADGVLASLSGTMQGGSMLLRSSFSGMCANAESVIVVNAGARGPRQTVSLDGSFVVQAPPGGPPAMMMSSCGSRSGWNVKSNTRAPQTNVRPSDDPNAVSTVSSSDDGLTLHVAFRSPRVIVFDGQSFVGDELIIHGGSSSTAGTGGAVLTVTGQQFRMASSGQTGGQTSMQFSGLQSAAPGQVYADVPSSSALSSSHSTVAVPVLIWEPAVMAPMRAFSVTFHLSPNLFLSSPIVEGDFLSRGNPTQMYVLDNGGGSYTVDNAILSSSCTSTGQGTLFTLQVSATAPASSGTGSITIDQVIARDCSNGPLSLAAGDPAFMPLAFSQPAALTGLAAVQQKTGNDADGTTKIAITCPSLTSVSTMELYRAPFGNYPRYDKAPNPGSVPAAPSTYPPGAPWTLTSVRASGDTDEPTVRDFFYYCAFAKDVFGNVSMPSNRTGGTLDYHLSDVSNGLAACAGDNRVGTADVSVLGSHYGQSVSPSSSFACLDYGPTTDFSVNARPITDGKINFEELVVLSINYAVVSAPGTALRPAAATANVLRVVAPALPAVGETFDAVLAYDGAGDAQALSAQLAYDHAVIEQVQVASGALLGRQGRENAVLSSGAGDVDAALLGAGPGIAGSGELARVTFRVKTAGDPQLAIAGVTARDVENRAIGVTAGVGDGAVPARTALGVAFPNPFEGSTNVMLSIRATGPASVGVYDIAGRRVRTLLQGQQPAGTRTVSWDGRNDAGLRLSAGVYLVRLEAAGLRETRLVRLVK